MATSVVNLFSRGGGKIKGRITAIRPIEYRLQFMSYQLESGRVIALGRVPVLVFTTV